jgi:hypothetical protein
VIFWRFRCTLLLVKLTVPGPRTPAAARISWSLDPGIKNCLSDVGKDAADRSIMSTSDQVLIPCGLAES